MNIIRIIDKGSDPVACRDCDKPAYHISDTIEISTQWTQDEAVVLLKLNTKQWDKVLVGWNESPSDGTSLLGYLCSYLQQQIEGKR